jgi:hypothetical protein
MSKSIKELLRENWLVIMAAFSIIVFNLFVLTGSFGVKNDFLTKFLADVTGSPVITATAGANGTISPGTISLTNGGSQLFTITANSGYHIQNVLVDGTSIGAQTYYTFSNVISDHTISATFEANEPAFSSPFGGPNSKSKGINYLPYMFVQCPTASTRASFVTLLKTLNIKQALFYSCFLMGDFTLINGSTPQELKDTVAYFKANDIAVIFHHYSDLIDNSSELAKDTRNIRRDKDGNLMSMYGGYTPTPAASSLIAEKMADAYNSYGFNGGIYFDAIDYYSGYGYYHPGYAITDIDTAPSFMNKVIKLIGGAPVDGASVYDGAINLYSRHGTFDSPTEIYPGRSIRIFADEHSSEVASSSSPTVPFMGWLRMRVSDTEIPNGYSVSDLQYYLDKTKSIGASYALLLLTPSNYTDPLITPYTTVIKNYNDAWNVRVITIQNPDGSLVSGANVKVYDKNNSVVLNATTNSSGYIAGNLGKLNGPYSITTTYNGKTQTNVDNLDSFNAVTSDTKIIFTASGQQTTSNLYCGDSSCNGNESCSSCPNDCGSCQASTNTGWGTNYPKSAPINLKAVVSSSKVDLTWSASSSSGVVGYTILRCEGANCYPATKLNTTTSLSYTDSSALSSSDYTYAVTAYDAAGLNSPQSQRVTVFVSGTWGATKSIQTAETNTGSSSSTTTGTSTIRVFSKALYLGVRDDQVAKLQTFLAKQNLYPSNLITGFFWKNTYNAVGQFQIKYGIVASPNSIGYGVVGPKTRTKLNELSSQ